MHDSRLIYPPLNTPKLVADDVWIVDGPVIRFGPRWFKIPFSTRATIIRLPDRRLFIHSPTPLVDELKAEIASLGVPSWIIGPNRLHYWWIPQWHAAFPNARVFLAPRIREQAGDALMLDGELLERETGYPWDAWIATLPVAGSYMTEIVFFHRPSRTLVLTDLIENFEADRLGSPLMRFLTRLGGVRDPDGSTPSDLRSTFARNKAALRDAVARMIAWNPERIILAHGRWYKWNGRAELRRAFRWIPKS
ncbi:DUF4336 domain-containing protein [Bradyrhizobium sp. CCBAU 51753]|uniref:DUF4336 domain-containing protein n=1 Tax=Bradyrhizobium sp. CCBAU 51753 TaxID=1325100 RepID=UPI00188A6A4C|nr:DUF4336 domain-containing protein [Bradyrhizobium sp. CCBAU 51753]QOZ28172.1 DUF4336 domain-containing protein [Bradyrhizobium sp. CCBAU 51753]